MMRQKVIDQVGKFTMPAPARSIRPGAAERPASAARTELHLERAAVLRVGCLPMLGAAK